MTPNHEYLLPFLTLLLNKWYHELKPITLSCGGLANLHQRYPFQHRWPALNVNLFSNIVGPHWTWTVHESIGTNLNSRRVWYWNKYFVGALHAVLKHTHYFTSRGSAMITHKNLSPTKLRTWIRFPTRQSITKVDFGDSTDPGNDVIALKHSCDPQQMTRNGKHVHIRYQIDERNLKMTNNELYNDESIVCIPLVGVESNVLLCRQCSGPIFGPRATSTRNRMHSTHKM